MIRIALQFMLVGALSAWTALQWMAGPRADPVSPSAERRLEDARLVNALVQPDLNSRRLQQEDFPQTLMSPVFFQGRRFPTAQPRASAQILAAQPPSETLPPSAPIEQIKFRGVVIMHGSRKALIEYPGIETKWLGVGEIVAGWTISAIDHNTITLSHGPNVSPVSLYSERPPFYQ